MTLYETLKAAGAEIDSHESDLYVKHSEEVWKIVKASGQEFVFFTDNIHREQWIEVPFAFDPYWEAKSRV